MGNLPLLVAAPKGNGASLQSVRLKSDFSFCDNCDLALEADHRIANHLAMLASYVGMKQRDIQAAPGGETDASVLLAFEGIRTQIKAVASLHRSLATQQRGSPVDLAEYLHQVCSPFMSGLSGAIELTEDLRTGCLVRSEQILPPDADHLRSDNERYQVLPRARRAREGVRQLSFPRRQPARNRDHRRRRGTAAGVRSPYRRRSGPSPHTGSDRAGRRTIRI